MAKEHAAFQYGRYFSTSSPVCFRFLVSAPLQTPPHEAFPPDPPPQDTHTLKPRPDGFDLRHGEDSDFVQPAASDKASASRDPGDGAETLAHMAAKLDRIEGDQNRL